MRDYSYSFFVEEKENQEFENASNYVSSHFPTFYQKKILCHDVVLTYRAGQSKFARQIMSAIRYNQILVVQAGVGIGKTIGYLIPVFSSYQNVKKMKHFVISTSNIGLQQQLLTDINKVSKMLDIELKSVIAKGINNYACINRIYQALNNGRNSEEEKAVIHQLLKEIEKRKTIDKDELQMVSEDVWNLVNLRNRGICSNCAYSKICLYQKLAKEINEANIVVTNHNNLAKSVLDGRSFIRQADMLIIDEAHKIEDAVRDIQGDYLDLNTISKTLNYFVENIIVDKFQQDYIIRTIKDIKLFFSKIRSRGSRYYFNNKTETSGEIVDCDKIPFKLDNLEDSLDLIIDRLKNIYHLLQEMVYRNDYRIDQLSQWISVFIDMKKKNRSSNIYWADFLKKDTIRIGYTDKSISQFTNKLVNKNVPIVFTSGTLINTEGTYDSFKESLSLTGLSTPQHPIYDGQICASPYNYDDHCLFYYDTEITNPNINHNLYLDELAIKIQELFTITNGRTLVLFTSKSDMNYVYQKIDKSSLPFHLFVQGNELSNGQLYSQFEKESQSCLFSTGAWEGIDVKGKSLSNVIITRLPFATDNAVMQYLQREYSKSHNGDYTSIFLNDMLIKLNQGVGRLIRSNKDKGIICCLDSRFSNYSNSISRILPFTHYTNNIEDVKSFSKKYITNQDGPRGPYKKRTKNEDSN